MLDIEPSVTEIRDETC